MEYESRIAKSEVLCGRHKLEEVWDRKGELVGELKAKPLKVRGSHVRKKCLQVSIDTPEYKEVEVRKCGVSDGRCFQQLPLEITVWNRRGKPYLEPL
jgi:hypothetical protein